MGSWKKILRPKPKCRQLGYAQDVGEITPGVNFVSAPVFGIGEDIVGCVILIGAFPESLIEKYGPKTADVARQISYKLGADLKTFLRDRKGDILQRAV